MCAAGKPMPEKDQAGAQQQDGEQRITLMMAFWREPPQLVHSVNVKMPQVGPKAGHLGPGMAFPVKATPDNSTSGELPGIIQTCGTAARPAIQQPGPALFCEDEGEIARHQAVKRQRLEAAQADGSWQASDHALPADDQAWLNDFRLSPHHQPEQWQDKPALWFHTAALEPVWNLVCKTGQSALSCASPETARPVDSTGTSAAQHRQPATEGSDLVGCNLQCLPLPSLNFFLRSADAIQQQYVLPVTTSLVE